MTTTLPRPDLPASPSPTPSSTPRSSRRVVLTAALVVGLLVAGGVAALVVHRVRTSDLRRAYLGRDGWPVSGQAAYRLGGAGVPVTVRSSPGQNAAPIASLAKVMTAYVVLRAQPLRDGEQGPVYTVTAADEQDYRARRARNESVVRVETGEHITERQALAALLLPSANNVAVLLARRIGGTTAGFVVRMNAVARSLGMAQTRYTDPSGYDPRTVSTARDQLTLAGAVAGDAVFADLVSRTSYRVPVAGSVRNTDALLGREGFIGTKTGSDDAAGGCFMFRTWRVARGRVTDMLGVVLGQHGRHDITAGLQAARQLARTVGPAAGG
ncbi:D-alanyl-D-alanine carboxypeptidase family protein [uncultured Jatrophihabitans sp.]|uniref:D-alanyl-D-alanine carboxypeptidase family protein n=1 Tax=uncultured Jatrophihabitans sp. TaxID=1610747 RepID=UPI0035CAE954